MISDDDIVYVVGDFGLGSKDDISAVLSQLSGYKILIIGNHDRSKRSMLDCGFDEVMRSLDITLSDGTYAHLRHYPLPANQLDDYDLQIHGHIHSGEQIHGKKLNVCVDMWDFYPLSEDEILDTFHTKITDDLGTYCRFNREGDMLTINAEIHIDELSGMSDAIFKSLYGNNRGEET